MMLNWDRIEPWDYAVISVASEYHKKYDMVELEDIKQTLYEWFLEHPKKLDEWEAIGPRDAKNLIYRSLRNQALDYCQKWKAKSVGYEVSDLFYYEAEMVEALLPSVLRGEVTETPKLNLGMPGRPPAPAEGGNLMAMMVEVSLAYDKLNVDDRRILFYKYAESLEYAAIASEMNITSEDAARMRHNRAIKKLITRLGGSRPFLESRDGNSSDNQPDSQEDNPEDTEVDNRENNGSDSDQESE